MRDDAEDSPPALPPRDDDPGGPPKRFWPKWVTDLAELIAWKHSTETEI
jgi:hypothetical protein